jgi:hypothetical protein
MKVNVKAFCVAVFCCGLLVSASAQINLLANSINFRDANSASNTTYHYGDLHLDGGTNGTGWGWLYCNQIYNYGILSNSGLAFFYNGLYVNGDLNVNGTKNFIQPHPTDSTKVIRYVCIESGEALTLARGTAKTQNSVVAIDLPEHFGLVTSDEAPLTVLVTPENVPAVLYTTKKTKSQIIVNMKQSDYAQFGDAEFSWQVTGVRDGFENQEVIVDVDNNGALKETKALSQKRVDMNEKTKKLMDKQTAWAKKKRK